MADATIHAGAVAPYNFRYTVTSTDPASFDLTTVSAVAFDVRRGSGKIESWSASVEGTPTASSLVMAHLFAVGDVPDPDCLKVQPRLTTPGGDFLAETKILKVVSSFDL